MWQLAAALRRLRRELGDGRPHDGAEARRLALDAELPGGQAADVEQRGRAAHEGPRAPVERIEALDQPAGQVAGAVHLEHEVADAESDRPHGVAELEARDRHEGVARFDRSEGCVRPSRGGMVAAWRFAAGRTVSRGR